jgi:hypothetical protein
LPVVQDRGRRLDLEHRTNDDGRARHHLTHGEPRCLLVLTDKPSTIFEEQTPPGPGLRPSLAKDQVTITDDTHDMSFGVDHGESADTIRDHQLRGLLDQRFWPDRNHAASHDIFDGQVALSNVVRLGREWRRRRGKRIVSIGSLPSAHVADYP